MMGSLTKWVPLGIIRLWVVRAVSDGLDVQELVELGQQLRSEIAALVCQNFPWYSDTGKELDQLLGDTLCIN